VAANLTSQPLRLEVEVDIELHWWDESGAFEASLLNGRGSLARRPAGGDHFEPRGWRTVQHVWSDNGWDWALSLYAVELAPGALATLKDQLSRQP